MLRWKPDLPPAHHDAWWAFLDCAEVIEGGRRVLLATLPTGRVEPVPIAVGVDALRRAIADARGWMARWRLEAVLAEWDACGRGLDAADAALDHVAEVAASTSELEELLGALQEVIDPLDSFADAERAWRRAYRLPRARA